MCDFLLNVLVSRALSVFTSRAGRLGHSTFPSLCLWSAGLWRYEGRGSVGAVYLRKGHADPRLWAFLKSTCFVLLHAGTPLAPLAQFALRRTLTWVAKIKETRNPTQKTEVVSEQFTAPTSHICFTAFLSAFYSSAVLALNNEFKRFPNLKAILSHLFFWLQRERHMEKVAMNLKMYESLWPFKTKASLGVVLN